MYFRIVIASILLLVATSPLSACPACKDALETTIDSNVREGYFSSIILMMMTPFILFGGWALFFIALRRKMVGRLQQQATA